MVSGPEVHQKLEEAEKAKREAESRAEKAEEKNRELEANCSLQKQRLTNV